MKASTFTRWNTSNPRYSARNGQSAAARVQKAMEKYDLFPDSLELSQKILVLEGDIGDEQLGLGPAQFNWLVD